MLLTPIMITQAAPAIERSYDDDGRFTTATLADVALIGPFGPPQPDPHFWISVEACKDPSEEKFERLAGESPKTLAALLQVRLLRPSDLTFAAEAAGKVADSTLVVRPLFLLLNHPSPLVREGAVYGLSNHLSEQVIERLREVAERDPSPGVREAAGEALEMW